MYYALTEKGLNRVEAGLPATPSTYYLALGALADLEEKHGGTRAFTEAEVMAEMGKPHHARVHNSIKSLVRNGLIETIKHGDERFQWLKEPIKCKDCGRPATEMWEDEPYCQMCIRALTR